MREADDPALTITDLTVNYFVRIYCREDYN